MSTTTLTSPSRPKLVAAGIASLEPSVERYVLKAGGTAGLEIDAGDRIEIAALEGGQPVEIVVFGDKGKSDLGALGLQGRARPLGIERALSEDTEDAARVRFGLYRRGFDLARAKAARVLAPDAGPSEVVALEAERTCFAVFGAPFEPMIVWEQTPPSDVLIFVRRANPRLLNTARLPDPIAEPRLDIRVDVASVQSFEVHEGEYIQIIDVQGRQCSDFLAFNRKALDEGREQGLDAVTTRTLNGAAYPVPGLLHSKFFDRDRNPLVEIVQDTVGRHDTFNLACTSRYYEDMGYFGHPNCTDNFNEALKHYTPISAQSGWPAINFFYNTNVDCHNHIWSDEPWSRPGDYVVMRALTDLVCGASSCPSDIDASNGWHLTEIQVRVYPKDTPNKRSNGYRKSPDAPLQLTRESGFHPRTSALPRAFGEYRGFWVPHHFANAGAIEEYWACREKAVIMDLSPLRKMEVLGPDSEQFLQGIVTRDVRKLSVGQVFYTTMCYEHGGMVDDGTLFRLGENNFRWIGGDDASLIWLKQQAEKSDLNINLKTATSEIHNVAVQGPKSREILREVVGTPPGRPTIEELGVFRFTIGRIGGVAGIPVMISRTGYSGERGYEIFAKAADIGVIWDEIVARGAGQGIIPCCFTVLDMLRVESYLIFYPYDNSPEGDSLWELGLDFTVSKGKTAYRGAARHHALKGKERIKIFGVLADTDGPLDAGDEIFADNRKVGVVTCGMYSKLTHKSMALARLEPSYARQGAKLDVRGKNSTCPAIAHAIPFDDPDKKKRSVVG